MSNIEMRGKKKEKEKRNQKISTSAGFEPTPQNEK